MSEQELLIVTYLKNHYTQMKAVDLAKEYGLEEFLMHQCKRYSVDYKKLTYKSQERVMQISRVEEYAKFFSDL
ncbi:MAG: hypothetical protein [Caudoviricetes sp.]|nr:MAG: hypothetical protein [Caudoviricetes sp.]